MFFLWLPLQDLLCELPAQEEFMMIVAAYNNSHKPDFVPPAINNRELDLYTVSLSSSLLYQNKGLLWL